MMIVIVKDWVDVRRRPRKDGFGGRAPSRDEWPRGRIIFDNPRVDWRTPRLDLSSFSRRQEPADRVSCRMGRKIPARDNEEVGWKWGGRHRQTFLRDMAASLEGI